MSTRLTRCGRRDLIRFRTSGGPQPVLHTEPRGAGGYTLCGDCNNRCARYSGEFIPWAYQWKRALDADPTASRICDSQRI